MKAIVTFGALGVVCAPRPECSTSRAADYYTYLSPVCHLGSVGMSAALKLSSQSLRSIVGGGFLIQVGKSLGGGVARHTKRWPRARQDPLDRN